MRAPCPHALLSLPGRAKAAARLTCTPCNAKMQSDCAGQEARDMERGRVIFLNGVTSAGKTSIV